MALDFDDDLYKLTLAYLKAERYSGSCDGKRFFLEKFKENEDADPQLRVCIWPEPYGYDNTAEELKSYTFYEFSQAGLDEAWNFVKAVVGNQGNLV